MRKRRAVSRSGPLNLEAVLCIAYEVKEEARPVMDALRKEGVKNIYLMTGDDERAAKVTAETLQVNTTTCRS